MALLVDLSVPVALRVLWEGALGAMEVEDLKEMGARS